MTDFLIVEKHHEVSRWSNPSLARALGYAATSVYTLFSTPVHEAYHRTMEQDLRFDPQPLHPDSGIVAADTRAVLSGHDVVLAGTPSFAEKIANSAYMMQFTDYFLRDSDSPYIARFNDVARLKSTVGTIAGEQGHPLSYSQQLDIALGQSDGDILGALKNLMLTSRHYARWLDSASLGGMPEMTPEQILTEMKEWRASILANKSGEEGFQDPAGDTYYAWTHALAAVLFGKDNKVRDRIGATVFRHGTNIMHKVVHTFNAQSVPNDHRVAAKYGNRIGAVILEECQRKS